MDGQPSNQAQPSETTEAEKQREQLVASLKVANGGTELFSVESETGGAFFVIRRATAAERRIYRKLNAEGKSLDAKDALMSCVIYPEKTEFTKVLNETPFVVDTLIDEILQVSGIYLDAVRKKL